MPVITLNETTSFSRMLDEVCAKTGIPRLFITRTIYSTAIAGFAIKKVLIPMANKINEKYKGLKHTGTKYGNELQPGELKTNGTNTKDDAVLAAVRLTSQTSGYDSSSSTAINKIFFRRLLRLLKIMLPGVWTLETGLLVAHTMTLISRTIISIHVALLEGVMLISIVFIV